MSATQVRSPISHPALKLHGPEKQLIALLREASTKRSFSDPHVIIRFTGGWVRDKLLNKESNDIDIAISSMTGHDFATEFANFLQEHHPELEIGSITKILANPEKSKHLDTATCHLLKLDLDFVQLRTESYATLNSRTPSAIGVGTLREDAERRDCTINALYYNIHSMMIEDPTGHGLRDLLLLRRIRTPLAPRKTFMDDPLRVLRCIRFAARFDFEIQAETLREMKSTGVRRALKEKVVKERVGIELLKMMKTEHASKALRSLRILHSQELYEVVFLDSILDISSRSLDFGVVERSFTKLHEVPALTEHLKEYMDGRLWLLIALLPYCGQMGASVRKPGLLEPLACSIVRKHLKLTASLENLVRAIFPPTIILENAESNKLELIRLVRFLGKDWKLCLTVRYLATQTPNSPEDLLRLIVKIHEEKLDLSWSSKCFVNGKKIKFLLNEFGADVKVMRELTERVVEYKLEKETTTEEEALSRLREYLIHRQPSAEGCQPR